MYLTLKDAKQHINVDEEYTHDDGYITSLIAVAEEAVMRHIDRPLAELLDENGGLPPPVCHAVRFLVGQLYANREPASFANAYEVPYTYGFLVSLYKRYTVR